VTTADHQHIPANQADLVLTTRLIPVLLSVASSSLLYLLSLPYLLLTAGVFTNMPIVGCRSARAEPEHGEMPAWFRQTGMLLAWHAACMASMTCQMASSHQSLVWYSQCLPGGPKSPTTAAADCSNSSLSGSSRIASYTLLPNMLLYKGSEDSISRLDQQAQHAQQVQRAN